MSDFFNPSAKRPSFLKFNQIKQLKKTDCILTLFETLEMFKNYFKQFRTNSETYLRKVFCLCMENRDGKQYFLIGASSKNMARKQ